ncbi:MAG TPA: hypothetical protein VGM00_17080, partial [Bradyrhizobium sp.]
AHTAATTRNRDQSVIREGMFILWNAPTLKWTTFRIGAMKDVMGQAERLRCPTCGAHLILAASPSDGKGLRMFQCFECDRPDPIKTDKVMGWLRGELQPPK